MSLYNNTWKRRNSYVTIFPVGVGNLYRISCLGTLYLGYTFSILRCMLQSKSIFCTSSAHIIGFGEAWIIPFGLVHIWEAWCFTFYDLLTKGKGSDSNGNKCHFTFPSPQDWWGEVRGSCMISSACDYLERFDTQEAKRHASGMPPPHAPCTHIRTYTHTSAIFPRWMGDISLYSLEWESLSENGIKNFPLLGARATLATQPTWNTFVLFGQNISRVLC